MWGALRSDFKEFASSIASDSTTIRNEVETKIVDAIIKEDRNGKVGSSGEGATTDSGEDPDYDNDKYSSAAVDEALARMESEETYIRPLLVGEINGAKKKDSKISDLKDGDTDAGDEDPSTTDKSEGEEGEAKGEALKETTDVDDSEPQAEDAIEEDGWEGDNQDSFFDEDNAEPIADLNENTEDPSNKPDKEQASDADTTKEEAIDASTNLEQDPAVLEFLKDFHIQEQTEDIGMVLNEHHDTVGLLFQNLVPMVVTYEQFWQRYYFRCDPDRIQQELDEEDERARKQRQEMLEKGKKTVQNLFGGALSAIKINQEAVSGKEASIYEKYQAELEEKQRALKEGKGEDSQKEKKESTGFGSLFSGKRPPFVMNTAVDEDIENDSSEEYDNEEEEEEEEDDEFGWGSDEEEDDDEDEDLSQDDSKSEASEEVVFDSPARPLKSLNSAELDELREELAKALQLNEELKQTVETQNEQVGTSTAIKIPSEEKDEMKKLELALFEKRAELAAFEANIAEAKDNSFLEPSQAGNDADTQSAEIQSLRLALEEKDHELAGLKDKVNKAQSLQDEEDATDNNMLTEALQTITSLQAELENSQADAAQELENQCAQYKTQISHLQNQVSQDQQSTEDTNNALAVAMTTIASLQQEIEETKANQDSSQNNHVENISDELNDKIALLREANDTIFGLQAEVELTKSIQDELFESKDIIASLQTEFETTKATLESVLNSNGEENEQNNVALIEAQKIISALNLELDSSRNELVKKTESLHLYETTTAEQVDVLSSELATTRDTLERTKLQATSEIDNLRSNLDTLKSEKNTSYEKKVLELELHVQTLTEQLGSQKLEYEIEVAKIRDEFEHNMKMMMSAQTQTETQTHSPSPSQISSFSSGVAVDVDDNDILPDTTQTMNNNVNVNINTSIENGENDDSDNGDDDVGWGDEGLSDDDA